MNQSKIQRLIKIDAEKNAINILLSDPKTNGNVSTGLRVLYMDLSDEFDRLTQELAGVK